jgi:hypothetical protein
MWLLATEHGAMVCGIVLGRDLVVTMAAGGRAHPQRTHPARSRRRWQARRTVARQLTAS